VSIFYTVLIVILNCHIVLEPSWMINMTGQCDCLLQLVDSQICVLYHVNVLQLGLRIYFRFSVTHLPVDFLEILKNNLS
jgi:hypothetical protein